MPESASCPPSCLSGDAAVVWGVCGKGVSAVLACLVRRSNLRSSALKPEDVRALILDVKRLL